MGSLKGAVSLIERKLKMIGDESDNDSKINRGSFVFFLKSSWKKIIAKKPNMKITRAQFRELTRDIAVEWRKLPRSSRDSYDALYENGFLIKNNLERQLNSNEINKYARGRRTTHSCLRVSESLYNILELVAKDQITNEKAIVVANKDRKKKRKQAKTAVAPTLKNDPEEQSQITSEFSSAMISGDAHVVQKKDDQSQATDAITDSAMRDVERSPSAAAKSSTHSIQSIKSTTSSRQSDKHMSLHLNSHGSIAPEPMVEEVTVERVQSVTESIPQSESSQKTDMDVENLEGEEMTIDDEETRINSSDDRPAVALAASVSQLVLADAFKANEAVNEMDAIDESEEIDPSDANSVTKVNTIYSSEEIQAATESISSEKLEQQVDDFVADANVVDDSGIVPDGADESVKSEATASATSVEKSIEDPIVENAEEESLAADKSAEESIAASTFAESVAEEPAIESQDENEDAISMAEPVMTQAEDQDAAQEAESSAEKSEESAPESLQSAAIEEHQAEVEEEAEKFSETAIVEEAAVELAEEVAEENVEESEKEESFNVAADGALTSSKNDLAEAISVAEEQVEVTESPIASVPTSPTAESPNEQEAVADEDVNSAVVQAEATNGDSDVDSDWVDEELDTKPEPKYTSSQKSDIASLPESVNPEQLQQVKPESNDNILIGEDNIVPESYVQSVTDQLSQVQITEKEEETKESEKERLEDIESVSGFAPIQSQIGDNLSAEVERVLSDVETILDDATHSQSVTESTSQTPSVSINQVQ